MNIKKSLQILLALAVVAVNAQDTTGSASGTGSATTPSGLPSSIPVPDCISTCTAGAGCAANDITCFCTNLQFQQAVVSCINTTCPDPAQALAQANKLQQLACQGFSSSASRSAAGTATAPPTGTGAATAGAATGATTSASSAVTRGDLGTGIVLSGLVALAGAVLGAGLVV